MSKLAYAYYVLGTLCMGIGATVQYIDKIEKEEIPAKPSVWTDFEVKTKVTDDSVSG